MPFCKVRQAQPSDRDELATMRALLWPDTSAEDHRKEFDAFFSGATSSLPTTILVSCDETEMLTGFLEVGLRSHADGCDPSHAVGYVEGWFVHKTYRNKGIGSALMHSAEDWARSHGCREMASDALIDNEPSHHAHQSLGFEVVDRCVHFRKPL